LGISKKESKKSKKYDWQITDPSYPCPECGCIEWIHMLDSLADACTECGYVRVKLYGTYEKGPSLQQWAKDIYEASEERKRQGKREK